MVTSAMASSFRVNASASQLAAKSARYASRTPDDVVESDGSDDVVERDGSDDELAHSNSFHSSRYRLADERAKLKEAEDVARVIRELQAQRQSRARPLTARSAGAPHKSLRASKDSRGSDAVRAAEPASVAATTTTQRPATARSPVARRMTNSATLTFDRSQHSVSSAVGASSEQRNNASTSASFQMRVLDELQRLKEAQRKDLEAIEQLQREKERAERRATQLEQQFGSASMRSSGRRDRPSETLVLDEPSDDDDCEADNDGSTDNEDFDLTFSEDLGDESLPPPMYDDDTAQRQQQPMTLSPSGSSHELLSAPETPPPRMWATTTTSSTSSKRRVHLPESTSPVARSSRSLVSRESGEYVSEQRGRSRKPTATHTRSRVSRERSRSQLVQTWDSSTEFAPESPLANASARVQRAAAAATAFRSRSPSATPRTTPRAQRSSSAVRSSTRGVNDDVRRSCAFFEEKLRAKDEETRLAAEAAERLERAKRAQPPQQLLERQEIARRRKLAQLQVLERELNAELSDDKRVRARDVPRSTYVVTAPAPAALAGQSVSGAATTGAVVVTSDELEAQRKERIRQRAQQLLASAELPPRMALAASGINASVSGAVSVDIASGALVFRTGSTAYDTNSRGIMSVKMKKQLAAAAEAQACQQQRKPKPVPDFDRLHAQWAKQLKRQRATTGGSSRSDGDSATSDTEAAPATATRAFFVARAATLADLQAKKAARRQRQLDKDAQAQRAQQKAQQQLLERTRASAGRRTPTGSSSSSAHKPKPTKADALRVQKVLERLAQAHKQQQREVLDADARAQKLKLAAKRVAAQVRVSEQTRVASRTDYVAIADVAQVAKQRASDFKRSLHASLQQNAARIRGAVASTPSLMERFATDIQREQHKQQALEAVVRNVFRSDLRAMKGILTDDEHALAQDIVAADRVATSDAASDSSKAPAAAHEDSADEYSDA